MNMQIREFAEFTGVSVRTLHYYDEIGLLKPARVDQHTGYRYYDRESLIRMQEILFYRELDFPLKSIRKILSSPDYSTAEALREQKKLLTLKKERLERLISAIDSASEGENIMKAFNTAEYDKYKDEVQQRWGNTDAYKEHAQKTKGSSREKWQDAAQGLNAVFAEFSARKAAGETPDSPAAGELVRKLQNFITENYYTCTKEILAGLGQMYVADDRFRSNIDQNGEGTADFASRAIRSYCEKN